MAPREALEFLNDNIDLGNVADLFEDILNNKDAKAIIEN